MCATGETKTTNTRQRNGGKGYPQMMLMQIVPDTRNTNKQEQQKKHSTTTSLRKRLERLHIYLGLQRCVFFS